MTRTTESTGDWISRVLALQPESGWEIIEQGYDPMLEREVESRLSVGNGLLGVRGSLAIPTPASRPRTYVAGFYDAPADMAGGPTLVSGPDWLRLSLRVDGHEISSVEEALSGRRVLDMHRGILLGDWYHLLPSGKVLHMRTFRVASLDDRHVGMQGIRLQCDAEAEFVLEALMVPVMPGLILDSVDGDVTVWRTQPSGRRLTVASKASLTAADGTLLTEDERDGITTRWMWTTAAGEATTFLRAVAFARHHSGAVHAARVTRLELPLSDAAPDVLASHEQAWSARWNASDVAIQGDEQAQKAARFAVYQLNCAANPEDERVSIGARALTGDGYGGHVFWDTEIFLLPFYTFTWPEAARSLLMYRFHTLPAARAKALRLGYAGALYAWESADTGEETTPDSVRLPSGETVAVISGLQEHHISSDVAYAIWQYWRATADEQFLLHAGAEVILETARFWASRATLEPDGLYHIDGVIGPDEYHETVNDNAYTNVMAQWNLETGLEVVRLMESRWPDRWNRLAKQLRLKDQELARWNEAASSMYTGFNPETGLFEQFRNYFELEDIDLAAFEPRTAPMDVLLGRERTRQTQVLKQADVVMLLALLWDRFPPEVRAANFHYYEPRCGHGSSLSPSVHSLVAARLGYLETAEKYFHEAAGIDLGDTMGNLAGGVHIASLGGLWQAVVFAFAGLSPGEDGFSLEPRLPRGWRSLAFPLSWKGSEVHVSITGEPPELRVNVAKGNAVNITAAGQTNVVRPGRERSWQLRTVTPEKEA